MSVDQKNQAANKSVLIGKVVAWTNLQECEHQFGRCSGHGEIIALLSKPLFLVRVTPEDDEPPYQIVLSLTDPTLHFHDDEASFLRWMEWLDRSAAEIERDALPSQRHH